MGGDADSVRSLRAASHARSTRADAEGANGAAGHHVAGPQNIRQDGPQAHAHRVRRLSPRPPAGTLPSVEVAAKEVCSTGSSVASLMTRAVSPDGWTRRPCHASCARDETQLLSGNCLCSCSRWHRVRRYLAQSWEMNSLCPELLQACFRFREVAVLRDQFGKPCSSSISSAMVSTSALSGRRDAWLTRSATRAR